MSEADYIAKGRYAEAVEQFETTKSQRDKKVQQIQRVLHPITDIMGATYGLDASLSHLAKEAVELDVQMREWAGKANIEAKTLGTQTLEIRESL